MFGKLLHNRRGVLNVVMGAILALVIAAILIMVAAQIVVNVASSMPAVTGSAWISLID
jgi:hypothetical protein